MVNRLLQSTNCPISKDNKTMIFVQSIEYNMRNIFLENHTQNCGGKTTPRPLSKKSKLSISLD